VANCGCYDLAYSDLEDALPRIEALLSGECAVAKERRHGA